MKIKAFIALFAAFITAVSVGCGKPQQESKQPESATGGTPSSEVTAEGEIANLDTVISEISKDYYGIDLRTEEECGISDWSVIGANKEKMTEILYPVPEDSEFQKIYNVADSGILPENKDNSPAFNAFLKGLKTQDGLKKVYFPKGVYNFSSTILINDLSDVYFVGEETTEIMMTEWVEALNVNNCTNVHFNGIDVDYFTGSTVTGKVVAANEGQRTVTIEINEGFDMTDYRFNGGKINYGNYMEFVKDSRTGDYYPDVNAMLRYNSTGDQVKMIENGVYDEQTRRLTLTFGSGWYLKPSIGKVVSVGYTMYEYFTYKVTDCKDFYMESCNIYSSLGMTFGFYSTENIYMNRANIVLREGSNKLMTATADGLHTNDCLGDLKVSNCIIENTHDDAVNVCTFYKTISSVANNVITCSAPNAAANFPTEVGDKLEIYNKSMEVVNTYTVENVENYGLVYEITVNKRVRDVEEGYLVGNLTRTPALTIENCIFRNKRNRGILCQTQNSVIKNCTFYNVIHGSVSLHSAFDGFFNEGLIPRNVTIENCKFINSNGNGANADVYVDRYGGKIVTDVIKGITVKNNFFNGNYKYGVSFIGAGSCFVENNLFYNGSKSPISQCLARIDTSSDIKILNNCAYIVNNNDSWNLVNENKSNGTVLSGNVVKGAISAN